MLSLLLLLLPSGDPDFDAHFTGGTLRMDYYHSGTAGEEHFSLDQIRAEGEWPGRRRRLLDDTNRGKYLFQVIDPDTHRVIYSHGFASIYGEWETTGEARGGTWRTLHESQRFPETRDPCQLVLKKRHDDGTFREVYSLRVDPASRFVNRSRLIAPGKPWAVMENGSPANKVDLLFLGDGYTSDDQEQFHADVRRISGALFAAEPFKRRTTDFNVWAVDIVSAESDVTKPREGTWRDSPLGMSYNSFDSERYVLTEKNKELREFAALAPYDALILLANSEKYGGGGIFNLWCTAAAASAQSAYLVVHEFGHSFAGLADEYYTSQVSYEEFIAAGIEPWEPNITALLDPARLKWRDQVSADTPVPTPWNQDQYDRYSLAMQERRGEMRARGASEEEMDVLFAEVKKVTSGMLGAEPHYANVGAFEGGGYQAKGLYRPAVDCIMFTRNPISYCRVCGLALEATIDLYVD